MSLLTEQERKRLEDDLEQQIGNHAFDAVERAILAKLASAELPEPVSAQFQTLDTSDWHNFIDAEHQANTEADGRWPMRYLFTAAQRQQAYAQGFAAGAASQLAQEPTALMYQHDETGRVGFLEAWGPIDQFKASNPRMHIVASLYTRREA